MILEIVEADFANAAHTAGIVDLLDAYASDPAGGGQPLSADVRQRLVPALDAHPSRLVLLAMDDGCPVGIAICFFGFSTFHARPLLNIHDLAVLPAGRGRGVGRALLDAAEAHAIDHACCRLTLEVQDDNLPARGLYQSFGFEDYVLGSSAATRFLVKPVALPGPAHATWPSRSR